MCIACTAGGGACCCCSSVTGVHQHPIRVHGTAPSRSCGQRRPPVSRPRATVSAPHRSRALNALSPACTYVRVSIPRSRRALVLRANGGWGCRSLCNVRDLGSAILAYARLDRPTGNTSELFRVAFSANVNTRFSSLSNAPWDPHKNDLLSAMSAPTSPCWLASE